MEEELLNSEPQDEYEREERCRKAVHTLAKAVVVRIAAGILLVVAVIASGAAAVAVGLSAFAFLIIAAGTVPLVQELKKQIAQLRELTKE